VAAALSRIRRDTRAAVAVSWASAAYAVLTGLLLASARPVADWSEVGAPVAAGGAGAILAGLLAMAALADGRVLAVAPAIAGAVVAGAALLGDVLFSEATGRAPAMALTAALVLDVLVGTALPTLALGAVLPASSRQLEAEPGSPTAPEAIDAAQVRADARLAGEILIAATAATGMLLVAVAPFAVSLGAAGASLAVLAALTVLLAARRRRAAAIARTGLVSGIAGLLASAAAILWLHPDWRPVAAVALPLGGLAVLGATLLPPAPSVRRSRLADLLERAALLALLPLLAVAAGLLDVIRGG